MSTRNAAINRRKAFTLIELLVVIAIIAILAAILFPVFAQAKRAAKDAVALSNLKQTGTSIMLYGGDYDDATVMWEYGHIDGVPEDLYTPWPILVQPYMKNTDIIYDPCRGDKPKVPAAPWTSADSKTWAWGSHMAINRQGYATDGNSVRTLGGMIAPAERLAFTWGENQFPGAAGNGHWFDAIRSSCPALSQTPNDNATNYYNQVVRSAVKYHGDGIIGTYADGHAKKVPYKKFAHNNATFGDSGQCEKTWFYGPNLNPGDSDDYDNELTRYWGRHWDRSY